jgi:hypothetical protein
MSIMTALMMVPMVLDACRLSVVPVIGVRRSQARGAGTTGTTPPTDLTNAIGTIDTTGGYAIIERIGITHTRGTIDPSGTIGNGGVIGTTGRLDITGQNQHIPHNQKPIPRLAG